MAIQKTDKIWHNGKLINWDDATIHVMSHVVHYGSSVFEGIRCYELPTGPAIFRANEHMQRLLDSAKVYRIDVDFTREQLVKGMVDTVGHNGAWPCYVRPIVLRGYGEAGVNPFNSPTEVYIINYPWGKYLSSAESEGCDVCVSSWTRLAPNTLPAMAKAGANYMNSQLIKMEAIVNGYVEGIALDASGFVSEGSGENLFLVHQRQADHRAAGQLRAARDHPRLGLADRARPEHPYRRADDSARNALHRRRGLLHRHRRRSHPDSLGRQDQSRQGRDRAHHQGAAERVLRHRARRKVRPPRLAHAGAGRQQSRSKQPVGV